MHVEWNGKIMDENKSDEDALQAGGNALARLHN